MRVTAVVTCHARTDRLRSMLGCLMYQTRPPDETLAYVSGATADELAELGEHFPHARFHPADNLEDWGHDKRAQGLLAATGDVIGWFNDDDDYDREYVATMLAALEAGAAVAYCDWNEAPNGCDFSYGSSTAGNFLILTELARRTGWSGRDYAADGMFINRVRESGAALAHIPKVLYTHNAVA